MGEYLELVQQWFYSLGENYGVNPLIFGGIYVGAIPFFTLSIGWLVRNYRSNQSILLPVISATLFFISSYLYLIIAGENVPFWVYILIGGMVVTGAISTYNKVRLKIQESDLEE